MDRAERTGAPTRRVRRPGADLPALDGLRAVAVVSVLLYHFGVEGMRGGFLGVDVFFVVSGYLITGQLVTRWVLGGQVSLRTFWTARARRLLPGLGALLVGTTATITVLDRGQLSLFRGDLAAAATYSSNWWYVFHERSYFVDAGRPPVLQHLWSLAVEEQFYLVWPLIVGAVVLLCACVETRLRMLLAAALAIAAASSLMMGVGSALSHAPQAGDPSRWYFGSDSHVMGLLLGAALALTHRGAGLGGTRDRVTAPARGGHTALGFAALALLVTMLSRTDELSGWLFRWGFLAVSLLTVTVVAVASRPGPLASVLERPVLRGIGRRSYAIYLWHWPVACFTRPGVDLPVSDGAAFALRLGLTLLLAEATYLWLEQPVRRHGWRPVWHLVVGARIGAFRAPTVITVFVAALVAGVVMPATAAPLEPRYEGRGTVYVADPGRPSSLHVEPAAPAQSPPGRRDRKADTSAPRTPLPHARPTPPHSRQGLRDYDLDVYGDSVPLGAIPDLAATFGSVANHAAVGAQSWALLPQLTADAQAGRLDGDVVLLHTGDNGVIDRAQLDSAISALSGAARVVLAVPYVPREWQAANRSSTLSVATRHRNVTLMAWDQAARSHPGYLGPDGIHLTPSGEHAYASLVAAVSIGR